MGSSLSSDLEEEDAVFVVPRYINFTPMQMSRMIEVGQQPGVPFRVGGHGAQRPQRPTKKAHVTKSLGSINKTSFSVLINEDGNFEVSFCYDALEPLVLDIYLGCKDVKSTKAIRVKSRTGHWGPFSLSPGTKCTWCSKEEFVDGDVNLLPCSYESDKSANASLHYDFMVILSLGKKGQDWADNMVITQASYYSVNCSNFAPSSTTQISRPVEVSGGYDLAKGEEVLEADMKTKSNSKQHRKDKRNRRNGHHALSSTKGKVAVTCRMQKVQMSSGDVYTVQDVYGMSTSQNENDADCSTANEQENDGGKQSPLDTDSPECVICLTDEKEVVVYPCRHMCMCITCAEALPSQNNKCPMCRRPASMLLRLKSAPSTCN